MPFSNILSKWKGQARRPAPVGESLSTFLLPQGAGDPSWGRLWITLCKWLLGSGLGAVFGCGKIAEHGGGTVEMTEDEILEDFPSLEKADFPAVYAYASQSGRDRLSR